VILYNTETIKYYNDVGAWADISLIDLFKDNVRKYEGEISLIDPINKQQIVGFKPDRITYSQLENRVDVLATNLIKVGIKKDDVVVVQLPNIIELVIAYLAITSAGAIISPVPMQWQRIITCHETNRRKNVYRYGCIQELSFDGCCSPITIRNRLS